MRRPYLASHRGAAQIAPMNSLNRFRLLLPLGLLIALFLAGCQSDKQADSPPLQESAGDTLKYPRPLTKESQAAMSPQEALAELRAGNERFVAGNPGFEISR